MIVLRLVLVIAFVSLTATPQPGSSQQSSAQTESVPASCWVTPRPTREFIPPVDYHPEKLPENIFLIGTEKLWTAIREPMVWEWRPHQPGHEQDLTAKIFWFRFGYSWRTEPIPKLKVTGRRLDGPAPSLMLPQGPATHAIMDDSGRGAMLTGVYVPTPGCWEISGDYEGDKLSFVVWVEPEKQASR
jgi:hypothetical protein